jgi:NAD(P)-dependent dehydrogenase (short-subunit alcohol dehydrogenase family)
MEMNKDYFHGKTAIVTGAAAGIGLALIEELLDYGAKKVVLADFNADNLNTHTQRLSAKHPGKVKSVLCNVTIEQEVADMIAEAAEFFNGRVDLLINNAGAGLSGFFTEPCASGSMTGKQLRVPVQTNEDWEKGFAINFYGALYGCRTVIPIMQKQGGGQILNIISGIVFSPMAFQSIYSATKAALNALTLSLRTEYWDDDIKFSSATPGTTATDIWGDMPPPDDAQTPQQSARRILAGAARNQRIIFGDDPDLDGAKNCFHADYEKYVDEYLLNVARERRKGRWTV